MGGFAAATVLAWIAYIAQKVVWHHQVFNAGYWTTSIAPDVQVANVKDSPWTLVGPVLPGDTPADAHPGRRDLPPWESDQRLPVRDPSG